MNTYLKNRTGIQTMLFGVCASGLLLSARAQAQPEDKSRPFAVIAPVQVAPVANVAGVGLRVEKEGEGAKFQTPVQMAPVADVAGIGVNTGDAALLEAVLMRLKASTLTPEAAWQRGDLTYANICDFFQPGSNEWIIHVREKDNGLHHALIALLVAHEGEKLKALPQVPPAVRLWLADYYQSSGDGKCIEVAESILAQMPRPLNTTDDTSGLLPVAFQAVEREGWFYRDEGQFEKGAETWLRLPPLLADQGWWQPDAIVEAARLYSEGNEQEKAQQLYSKARTFGDSWSTSVSYYDQARTLISQRKLNDAASLLERALKQEPDTSCQVILLSMMSLCKYQQEDFKSSSDLTSKAIALYDLDPSTEDEGRGINSAIGTAIECRSWAEQWQKQPIVCWPRSVAVKAADTQFHFNVRTMKGRNLLVKAPKGVDAHLEGVWVKGENGFCVDAQLIVSLNPEHLKRLSAIPVEVVDSQDASVKDTIYLSSIPDGGTK